ncbi:MAG TPA: hypothetical protein VL614_14775 [Acetobacteraceae bacterium]|nr:hypothetical protein [Acetobacteraceae bacterium]
MDKPTLKTMRYLNEAFARVGIDVSTGLLLDLMDDWNDNGYRLVDITPPAVDTEFPEVEPARAPMQPVSFYAHDAILDRLYQVTSDGLGAAKLPCAADLSMWAEKPTHGMSCLVEATSIDDAKAAVRAFIREPKTATFNRFTTEGGQSLWYMADIPF